MSYIRYGHDLEHFEGESELYVVSDDDYIVDYNATYEDNASFAQLCFNMFRRQIKDDKYLNKIKHILADKLNVKVRQDE